MKRGYFLTIGKKALFLEAATDRKNPSTVKAMIKAICVYRGFCEDMTARILADKECYTKISHDMQPATLELKELSNGVRYYSIKGDYFGGTYDLGEIIAA